MYNKIKHITSPFTKDSQGRAALALARFGVNSHLQGLHPLLTCDGGRSALNRRMTEIIENYKEYCAPNCVSKSLNRLIRYTPTKYFSGLHLIELTNSAAFNRRNRRQKTKSRKRKVALNACEGWYIQKWNNQPARIELIVDKIYYGYPSWVLKIGFISDLALSGTFFHELGHHIHKTQAPEHVEREDVADKWKRRLARKYFWTRYWYIMGILWPFRTILNYLLKRYKAKQN